MGDVVPSRRARRWGDVPPGANARNLLIFHLLAGCPHVTERAELYLPGLPPYSVRMPLRWTATLRKEDIQERKLMEEVHWGNGIITQREMARRLNVSVGLTNVFIKRVVRKGYV